MPRKLTLEERIEKIRERKRKYLESMKREADAIFDSRIEVLQAFGPKKPGLGMGREAIERMFQFKIRFYTKKGVENAAEKAAVDIAEWRAGIRGMGIPDIRLAARERIFELLDEHAPRFANMFKRD